MKKLSWIKRISLGGSASVAAIAPIALTTSCVNTKSIATAIFSWNDVATNGSLANIKDIYSSYDDILLGSKKFWKGNYILFVGSTMFDATCTFFSGDAKNKTLDLWRTTSFESSCLNNDVLQAKANLEDNTDGTKTIIDFGFLSFIDNWDGKVYDNSGHEIHVTTKAEPGQSALWHSWNIGPFDTWTNETITQTRLFMKNGYGYDWNSDEDNPEVVGGDYIRQDAQAKSYRDFVNRGKTFFPTTESRTTTFDNANDNKTSLMVIYKDGRMQEIVSMPTSPCSPLDIATKDTSTLAGAINTYFIEIEEDEE